ncbi:MAG TPA: VWA domain-containing protein [Acidobacteriaceae bacterium]|nr:VWA domain-containing protein [Acidobacteriaceae bacterium]
MKLAPRPCLCSLLAMLFLTAFPAQGLQEPSPQTTIRVQSSEVLVPTLVQNPSGEILYGLGPADFELLDNGVQQQLHVDDDLDNEPVSVVVAVEKGRMAELEFDKINRLAPLIDLFLGDGASEAAFVSFDSKPQLVVPFTRDAERLGHELKRIEPGDGEAAILDTVGYSVKLLEDRPKDYRRVLLLISETRDHGSHDVDAKRLVEQIGTSNTLVLSVTFSPSKALFLHNLTHDDGATGPDLMAPVLMAVQAVRKNVAREIALMSGGEYAPFTTERGFEDRVQEVAKHARNRYLLSFRPTDNTPGLHQLDVRLTRNPDARVVARTSYWALDRPSTP